MVSFDEMGMGSDASSGRGVSWEVASPYTETVAKLFTVIESALASVERGFGPAISPAHAADRRQIATLNALGEAGFTLHAPDGAPVLKATPFAWMS